MRVEIEHLIKTRNENCCFHDEKLILCLNLTLNILNRMISGVFRTNVASVGSAIKGTHKNILKSFATLNDKNRIDNSHDRLNFDPGNMNKIFHFS